jgi:raffinose/stachyose/melibiose transport system permease protein
MLFRYTRRTFARELGFLLLAAVFCVPLFVLASASVKSTPEIYTDPLALPKSPTLHNFREAWNTSAGVTLGRGLVNSLIITIGSVLVLLLVGSLCAYVLARRPSRLTNGLYVLFVLGFVIPAQLGTVPIYVVMRNLHLTGSYVGMIILYAGLLMPLSVFLYTGFVRALPREYEESARVDGAGLVRTFARVVFPLLRPVTGTTAVLTGIFIWNDFFNPLIFLGGTKKATLPVTIYSFVGENISKWNVIFAGVIISILPVLAFYLLAQRQLIRGFSGGIRG